MLHLLIDDHFSNGKIKRSQKDTMGWGFLLDPTLYVHMQASMLKNEDKFKNLVCLALDCTSAVLSEAPYGSVLSWK